MNTEEDQFVDTMDPTFSKTAFKMGNYAETPMMFNGTISASAVANEDQMVQMST